MRARSCLRSFFHGIALMATCAAPAHAVSPIVIWVTNSNNFGAGSYTAALAQLQPIATPQEIRFSYPSTQTIYLNGPQSVIVGSDVRIDGVVVNDVPPKDRDIAPAFFW